MKKKFIEKSVQIIKSSKAISRIDEKKIRYGLEAFYNLITKLIVLIIIAILLGTIKELILLAIIYSSLRMYGFGIHAKKSWQCWLTTVPIYIGGCLFIKYASIANAWFIVIWIISFIIFALYAPADTPARPLIHKEKRIRAKILSLSILIAYLLLTIFLKNSLFTKAIIYGLLMEDICIIPITYKIFNTNFNNYKTFNKNLV